jgi:hypothetical protein
MVFTAGSYGLANGTIDWSADTIRARLSPTSETLSPTATSIVGLGLPETDVTLRDCAGPFVDYELDRVWYTAANFQFLVAPADVEVDKVIIFHEASGTPIAAIRLNPPAVGPPVNVTIPASGLFWLQAATA